MVNTNQHSTRTDRPLDRRDQLGDEVASFLRDLIMSGQLRGHEYIRMEHVASHLRVSVTPVREALMSLRAEGFVSLEPRKGFIVLPLNEQDVRDLFLAHSFLAGELASHAATFVDDAVLERLHAIQVRLTEAGERDDPEAIELENYRFHREINLLAASPKLAWLLNMVARYSPRRFYANIEGWPKASIDDHELILEALAARDEVRARVAMSAHIVNGGNLLADFLHNIDDHEPYQPFFN